MSHSASDSRVDDFVFKITAHQKTLEQQLEAMKPTKDNLVERHNTYNKFQVELSAVNSYAQKWAKAHIKEFMLEADKEAIDDLDMDVPGYPVVHQESHDRIVTQFCKHMSKAIRSLSGKAFMIMRFSGALPQDKQSKLITIVGKNGKARNYDFDFYCSMVAHSAEKTSRRLATVERAKVHNHKYFKISDETSGSSCDVYKGRVYSLKGLQSLPNQGPPFHPFCKHSLRIYKSNA